MTHLQVRLLGPFQVARRGRVITEFEAAKTRALLAYLAAEAERPHRREALAEMLWPDRPEGAARANLRHTLANLRHAIENHAIENHAIENHAIENHATGDRAIGDRAISGRAQPDGCEAKSPFLLITRKTIQFNTAGDVWVDVAEFESLAARSVQTGRPNVGQLKEALALYRGSFLEDLSVGDSAAFEEWALLKRENLSRQVSGVLNRLAEWYVRMGEYERALEYARRRVDLEPWDEERQRQMMRLLALAGQRSAALAQYEACRQVLQEELGVEPEEETTRLYERIRDGEELPAASPLPLHNLPAPVTPFIGREAELAKIGKLLRDSACRHLSLVGPGGCGKTRLALEAAADFLSGAQVDSFRHGVFFVSLAPLQSPDGIVPAVAQAIGFSFYAGGEPRQQLLDYLRQKYMLLVMDNFEHLLSSLSVPPAGGERGGENLVADILKTAPGVKILTTSRARLNLQGEHLFHVGGMDLPPLLSCEDGERYDAVELFLAGARRVEPGFELTDDNVKDVVRVCRLVEGMPLPILLAAAWVEVLTPGEIAAEISRSLDFLETNLHDVPQRQRSMRATLDHSWNLLTEREREVFRALSVFRGGFTREAAQQVTGASLQELMALVNKSLLHRTPMGRYEIHELLRQYAEEKLDREPAAGKAARDLHCAYYTAALRRWETDLKGPRQQAALAEMDVEIENARAAWDWAVEQGQVDRLDRAMEGLCLFYWRRSRNLEGGATCRMAASKLAEILAGDGPAPPVLSADGTSVAEGPVPPVPPVPSAAEGSVAEGSAVEGLRVWARVLVWQAFFIKVLGRSELALARQLLQQSLAILERLELANQDIRVEKAFVLLQMGKAGPASGYDFHQARRMYEQSLALYRAVGDRWWTAKLLDHLCLVLIDAFCAHNEAKQLAEESLTIGRALGDLAIVAKSLVHLGYVAGSLGQIEESERLFRESIPIYREIGARDDTAVGLLNVGCGLTFLAKFDEAHSLLEENLAILSDLGASSSVAYWTLWLGYAKAHLGQYEQARIRAQISYTFFQEHGGQSRIALSLFILGFVALAEQAYAEAWQLLQESVAVFRRIKYWEIMSWGLSLLGYAPYGLGQLPQAERHFYKALRTTFEIKSFVPCLLVLPGIALLLADLGEVERGVELYALASRYGLVANSRWFEDVAGRHVAEAAATLPPEVVAAARERGRARDMDATVKELLAELGERAPQTMRR